MLLVQSVISSTQSVTEEHLALPKRQADFQNESPESEKFNTAKLREDSRLKWPGKEFRGEDYPQSDFVRAFPMAGCPHCQEEKGGEYTMVIPHSSFTVKGENQNRKCPQCGKELPVAPEITKEDLEETGDNDPDRDNDGVLDEKEKEFGMDSTDPHDARYDIDGDGFSSIFEINNNYAPNNPESHPPYWWRLRIDAIRQIELPVRFMALNDNGFPNDKTRWTLQFNHPDRYGRKRTSSSFLRIGRTIMIEGRNYKVTDVERRVAPVKDGAADKGGKGVIDTSRVFLVEVTRNKTVTPDKLVMTVNQPAYSSDKRPVLYDCGDISEPRKKHVLRIGDRIQLESFAVEQSDAANAPNAKKNRKRVVATYRLTGVDAEKEVLQFVEVVRNKKKGAEEVVIEVTKEGKVPNNMLPIKKVERVANAEGNNTEE